MNKQIELTRIYEPDCECSADYDANMIAVKYYPCSLHPGYGNEDRRDFAANPVDYLKY